MKSPSFATDIVFVNSVAANVEFSVPHQLGRVPVEGFVIRNTEPGGPVLYRGTTAWTRTRVYLKSNSTGGTYLLMLI